MSERSIGHCAAYAATKLILLAALIFNTPDTVDNLANAGHPKAWAFLLVSFGVSAVQFFFVQGSDPGYLTEDILRSSRRKDNELLSDEQEPAEFHRERISVIELEIQKCKVDESRSEQPIGLDPNLECPSGEEKFTSVPDGSESDSLVHFQQGHAPRTFCADCGIIAPLRSHHCRACERCVAKYDHHCFLLGTCIGERNHCRFWWFLLLQSAELLAAIIVNHFSFRSVWEKESSWLHANASSLLLAIVLWGLLLFASGLCCFHAFLALTCSTTHEFGHGPERFSYLQGFRECDLPFSRGLCGNLRLFCRPQYQRVQWQPTIWEIPKEFDRDSDQIWNNLWENKYYSCC